MNHKGESKRKKIRVEYNENAARGNSIYRYLVFIFLLKISNEMSKRRSTIGKSTKWGLWCGKGCLVNMVLLGGSGEKEIS